MRVSPQVGHGTTHLANQKPCRAALIHLWCTSMEEPVPGATKQRAVTLLRGKFHGFVQRGATNSYQRISNEHPKPLTGTLYALIGHQQTETKAIQVAGSPVVLVCIPILLIPSKARRQVLIFLPHPIAFCCSESHVTVSFLLSSRLQTSIETLGRQL